MIIVSFSTSCLSCSVYVALARVAPSSCNRAQNFLELLGTIYGARMENHDIRRVVAWSNNDPSFVRPARVPSEEYPTPSEGKLYRNYGKTS